MSRPTATPADGVTFEDILRYVMRHLRMTETRATFRIEQVLRAGIALKKIEKTVDGRYRLLKTQPPGLACKIHEDESSDD